MQDRNAFESYLRRHSWSNAYEWLQKELCFMQRIRARQCAIVHTFGVTMSLVAAFFTWVVLFPSADEKELAAFPLATVCHDLFLKLSEALPGGKVTVVIAAVLIPFLLSIIAALVFMIIKPKPSAEQPKSITPNKVEQQIKLLSKIDGKYQKAYITLFLYTFFAGIFSGGVMVFSAAGGGLNPFEHLFVGIICDIVYGLVFGIFSFLLYWFKGVKDYPTYKWSGMVDDAKEGKKSYGKSSSTRSESNVKHTEYYKEKYNEYYNMYMGQPNAPAEEEDDAARLARETTQDLEGMGWGDY